MAEAMKDYRTRNRLLEAAGRVFAEKGYDRATGREICRLAGVNPAAVNYHFGGKDKLYREALREADRRLISPEVVKAAMSEDTHPEQKLQAFLTGAVRALLSPSPESWGRKLIVREMTAPTKALRELARSEMLSNLRIFRQIVASVMELPSGHPAAVRGSLLAMATCMFVFQNKSAVERAIEDLEITPKWVEEFAKDVNLFCIAGLRAVSKGIRRDVRE